MRASVLMMLTVGVAWPAWGQGPPDSVKSLALALAAAGTPAGVVISVDDFEAAQQESRTGQLPSAGDADVQRFAENRPEFAVVRSRGAVRLMRADAPAGLMELLNRPRRLKKDAEMPASAAVVQVAGALLLQQTPGELGVLGAGAAPAATCPLSASVRLAAGSTTALAVLDEVVRQVPGVSWFVLYHPAASDKAELGLWCPDGSFFRAALDGLKK